MIRWKGLNNQSIDIDFTGYSHPNSEYIEDKNWIDIRIKASTNNTKWEATDCSFSTINFLSLTYYLKDSVNGEELVDGFIDADAGFWMQYLDNVGKHFVFTVTLKSRLSYKANVPDIILVYLTESDISESIKYLENMSLKFPPIGDLYSKAYNSLMLRRERHRNKIDRWENGWDRQLEKTLTSQVQDFRNLVEVDKADNELKLKLSNSENEDIYLVCQECIGESYICFNSSKDFQISQINVSSKDDFIDYCEKINNAKMKKMNNNFYFLVEIASSDLQCIKLVVSGIEVKSERGLLV